jgi:hypothetical protein
MLHRTCDECGAEMPIFEFSRVETNTTVYLPDQEPKPDLCNTCYRKQNSPTLKAIQ